jgi:hypothetical protein
MKNLTAHYYLVLTKLQTTFCREILLFIEKTVFGDIAASFARSLLGRYIILKTPLFYLLFVKICRSSHQLISS